MQLIGSALLLLIQIVKWLIFIRCILSWISVPDNAVVHWIFSVTEPIMRPARSLAEKLMGSRPMVIDFSPIILFLIIQIFVEPIIRILFF